MRLRDSGEFSLIDRVTKGLRSSGSVIKGIGDDAAVLRYKKNIYLLFTSDMLVEGRHFKRSSGGYLIGKKSLSANISDIAAMGGQPEAFVVSLGVPGSLDVGYVDDLYRGIKSVARKFKVDLAGGDTVESAMMIINIALLGSVEKTRLVLRNGAKEGDAIFITGAIGGSSRGRHLRFEPRLKEACFLVSHFKLHSMIDVSDGLFADLGHILKSSKVGALICENDIPLSKGVKDFDSAVKEGEDFELIFTLSEKDAGRLKKVWPFRTRLSRIGKVCGRAAGSYLVKRDGTKTRLKPAGYTHFCP